MPCGTRLLTPFWEMAHEKCVSAMTGVEPFVLSVPEEQLDHLRRRLADTRWPEAETVPDWSQGAPLSEVMALCEYWRTRYDWRRCEQRLNELGQFRTNVDGLGIHFLHVRSPRQDAIPILMTHGWPGSVVEFLKVAGPLSDPEAHGATNAPAFHLVIPSLPGYGFSDKPTHSGWSIERTAQAWIILMERLGYEGYIAQGGDWGGAVASAIGRIAPTSCIGLHLNMPVGFPSDEQADEKTEEERAAEQALEHYYAQESGYAKQQATRPQTLGYGLADSPSAQAAWIYEKFHSWSDHSGRVDDLLTLDELLDNIMLYWLPNAGASSARMYWESIGLTFQRRRIEMPTACTRFPREIFRPSRRWAENSYSNLVYWSEVDRGGHFGAFEQPDIFVNEIRSGSLALRG